MPPARNPSLAGMPLMATLLLWAWVLIPGASFAQTPTHPYEILQKRLLADGFQKKQIAPLYNHPSVKFDVKSVALFFRHRESKLNYDQFTTRSQVVKGRRYIRKHQSALSRAEQQWGVEGAVITAILLVETQLGAHVGRRGVFNTLSTLAALDQPAARHQLWQRLTKTHKVSRKQFYLKADQKARFGYENLTALLKFSEIQQLNPLKINGSYAGAFGIPQFMPTSALKLATDGNGDGRIDLFTHEDAIFSTATYLKHYGWHPKISSKNAYEVILKYNYSGPYARTILKLTQLLTPST